MVGTMSCITLLLLLIILVCILINMTLPVRKTKNHKYPPGPWKIPLVGMIPLLAINPSKVLEMLESIYGKIFTIYLGEYRVVVLNNYEIVKEAFKQNAFSGRPNLKMLEVRNRGVWKGLVCSQGKHWMEQRKFTMKHLKGLGIGKHSVELLVRKEAEEFVEALCQKIGGTVDLSNRFGLPVLNALWTITCGVKYKQDDFELQSILKNTAEDLAETQYTGPLLFMPWLLKVAPFLTRWNKFKDSVEKTHAYLQSIITAHREMLSENKNDSFVDQYLRKISSTDDKTSSFYRSYGEESLQVVLLDLLMAGADTTNTALSWAFLYMILNPRVQRKVQEEIDRVIGQHSPTLEHRKLMTYTEATILEVLRKSSFVPLGLYHSAVEDSKLNEFDIKKDTIIIANLNKIHHDKRYWKDPDKFFPERFLESSGELCKPESFMPFSTGKRVCPGESFARDEIFLFFTMILQKFDILPHPNHSLPSEKPNIGVIYTTKPYHALVKSRHPDGNIVLE